MKQNVIQMTSGYKESEKITSFGGLMLIIMINATRTIQIVILWCMFKQNLNPSAHPETEPVSHIHIHTLGLSALEVAL